MTIKSGTQSVTHNSDGTKSISYSFSVTDSSGQSYTCGNASASGTMSLTTIPRYAYFSTQPQLSAKTETTLDIYYKPDRTIGSAQYRIKTSGGSYGSWTNLSVISGTWNTTAGCTFRISSRAANTTYVVQMKITEVSSGLETTSNEITCTTYAYPYCTEAPSFKIGDSVTIKLYNPLNRTVNMQMWSHVSQTFMNSLTSISGTSYTFTPSATNLYASIPNTTSSQYNIDIHYSSNKAIKEGGTYSTKGTEVPTFANDGFAYQDINSTTIALTGNNQILVSGYSNVQATVPTDKKATANNSATMKSYKMQVGSMPAVTANYSSSAAVTMTTNAANSGTITVHAIDSRGYSKAVTKTATIKNYTQPVISQFTAERANNGVGAIVTINFRGTYWGNSFGSVNNTITTASYKYRSTSSSTWVTGTTTLSVTQSNGTFSGTATINGDQGASGFSNTESFYIQLSIQDKLATKTSQVTLKAGTPALSIYKNKIAIGQQYDESDSSKLQVNGNVQIYGEDSNIFFSGVPLLEKVTNNNDTALKYYDGTMIVYGKFSLTPTWGTWGSLYSSDITLNRNYPVSFIAAPVVQMSTANGYQGGNGWIARIVSESLNKLDGFTIIRPTTYSGPIYFQYMAIGKWK